MSQEKQLTKNAGRVALGTMVSRILGYIRDMLVAHVFGAGLMADAFYAAYRIPNLLRRLLGEGSLSASFIPVLSEYLNTRSKEETQELINIVFTALAIVLAVLMLLGIVFAPQIVHIIAYGFTSDPEKFALTVNLTRLMFPFLLFICLAALLLGIANTLSRFFIAAVAPASLSVAEIVFVMGIAPLLTPDNQIKGLAISVIAGGLGQFLIQWPQIRNMGWHLKFKINFNHPGLKRIGLLMLPALIGLSVDQINAFVDTMLASSLEQGSITALYYSNRVMQLPLAIFGIAFSSVALPAMSKAVAEKNKPVLKETFNFAVRFIIFILVPSAIGLMVIGYPIIHVLFERGQFNRHATLLTNSAMFYYSLGLPAYAIAKVVASAFYSHQETRTPVKIAAMAMILNVILCLILMRYMGVGGLALASAVASYFNSGALLLILRKKIGLLGIRRIIKTTLKTLTAGVVMAVFAYWVAFRLLANQPFWGMTLSLLGGVLVYYAMSIVLDMEERKPLLAFFGKQ